ncbi:MAG: sodium ion-translocating decarboxylase subunit beta [Oscillospiraceae bacterium]|nr:sodium ion-translocating decarboxylase subunit beta [Oscillospiraceae bacterium]
MLQTFLDSIMSLWEASGFAALTWRECLMLCISFVLMYLAIKKGFEPLLLLPIAFGMFLANLPLTHLAVVDGGMGEGLLNVLYTGVRLELFPPLIFLGIGCMTDFGPLIANPKSFLLGAAAQGGIFAALLGAAALGLTPEECASIAIIGGADGPTAIYVSNQMLNAGVSVDGTPFTLSVGTIAVAAYSYMALVPVIQPPIMKALTTKKERQVVMSNLRPISKTEKVIFPVAVTLVVSLLVPAAAPLVGMLMFGNLLKESGVCSRLVDTASNAMMNIVTIMLGISVGATTSADTVVNWSTLKVILLGLAAFSIGTACGVLFGKIMYLVTGGKVNPLIGSAGVSAVPMAARISQKVGAEANPTNFLLMHAMGPNVAGVIGSAVAAGVLMAIIPH